MNKKSKKGKAQVYQGWEKTRALLEERGVTPVDLARPGVIGRSMHPYRMRDSEELLTLICRVLHSGTLEPDWLISLRSHFRTGFFGPMEWYQFFDQPVLPDRTLSSPWGHKIVGATCPFNSKTQVQCTHAMFFVSGYGLRGCNVTIDTLINRSADLSLGVVVRRTSKAMRERDSVPRAFGWYVIPILGIPKIGIHERFVGQEVLYGNYDIILTSEEVMARVVLGKLGIARDFPVFTNSHDPSDPLVCDKPVSHHVVHTTREADVTYVNITPLSEWSGGEMTLGLKRRKP